MGIGKDFIKSHDRRLKISYLINGFARYRRPTYYIDVRTLVLLKPEKTALRK